MQLVATTAGALTGRFALNVGQRVLGAAANTAAASTLSLWPNPATAMGAVRISGAAAGQPLLLLDGTGRTVRVLTGPADGRTTLSLAGLPAGVYVLRSGEMARRLVVE